MGQVDPELLFKIRPVKGRKARSSTEGVDCKPTCTLPMTRVEQNSTTIWLAYLSGLEVRAKDLNTAAEAPKASALHVPLSGPFAILLAQRGTTYMSSRKSPIRGWIPSFIHDICFLPTTNKRQTNDKLRRGTQ